MNYIFTGWVRLLSDVWLSVAGLLLWLESWFGVEERNLELVLSREDGQETTHLHTNVTEIILKRVYMYTNKTKLVVGTKQVNKQTKIIIKYQKQKNIKLVT